MRKPSKTEENLRGNPIQTMIAPLFCTLPCPILSKKLNPLNQAVYVFFKANHSTCQSCPLRISSHLFAISPLIR